MSRNRVLLLVALLFVARSVAADEIKVVTSGAFTAAYNELAPRFERATGHKIITAFGASIGPGPDAIPNRLQRGEAIDVVIMASDPLDDLIAQGKVAKGSRTDLVRSRIGMAVRAGAPRPDISTADAFKRAILEAKTLAFSSSASGVYFFNELFPRMGIVDVIKKKTTMVQGPVGAVVARGEAELGFQQISELLPVKGIDFVGPLPEGVQRVTIFSAGMVAGTPVGAAARALMDYLASPAAFDAIRKSGLDPAAERSLAAASAGFAAQTNRIDVVAPMAPELAAYGSHAVGVRTTQVTDKGRPDIVNAKEGTPAPRYDRTLTLEIWYPATLAPGQKPGGDYQVITRDPAITATLHGQAVRDAAPVAGAKFPLVVISHGYPGNRFLMSHLAENLASKGFVAVAIDHKDSTYDDQKIFGSTLYNRPFDQLFVVNEMAKLPNVDASRVGIVGYSMGGYGVVNVIGGGYSKASETIAAAPPNKMLAERGAANPNRKSDPRIKAAIAIAPWGMQGGFWDAEGLKGITTPVFFVAGSVDDVAGYEKGTKAVYQGAVNADRYLLTFINANHNAAAPIPAPAETYRATESGRPNAFAHYADAVWDTTRMNNILDHFATAYFGLHLKGEEDKKAYFEAGWKGFKRGTTAGLTLEHASPAKEP